jgi:hypothetical protein
VAGHDGRGKRQFGPEIEIGRPVPPAGFGGRIAAIDLISDPHKLHALTPGTAPARTSSEWRMRAGSQKLAGGRSAIMMAAPGMERGMRGRPGWPGAPSLR